MPGSHGPRHGGWLDSAEHAPSRAEWSRQEHGRGVAVTIRREKRGSRDVSSRRTRILSGDHAFLPENDAARAHRTSTVKDLSAPQHADFVEIIYTIGS
jgi:hypothetical protein